MQRLLQGIGLLIFFGVCILVGGFIAVVGSMIGMAIAGFIGLVLLASAVREWYKNR